MEQLLLRPEEVQKALNISRAQVYRLARLGLLPHVRIGRSVRFPADAIVEWIKKHQAGGE